MESGNINQNNTDINNITGICEKTEKCCGTCRFYEVVNGNYGRCKCTDANGYDLIVEDSSYCESYEK